MGMSTFVVGFKPPDEKFRKMKAAWDACHAAGIAPPKEVADFFRNVDRPDDNGVEVNLEHPNGWQDKTMAPGVTKWNPPNREQQGFEVDLRLLDPDIKILRFYNGW